MPIETVTETSLGVRGVFLLFVKAYRALRRLFPPPPVQQVTVFAYYKATGSPAVDVEHVPAEGDPERPDHRGNVHWPASMLGMTVSIRDIETQREVGTYVITDAGGDVQRVPIGP